MNAPRILIVEDDSIIAFDLKRIVLGLGCEVIGVAALGREAVALAAAQPPDAVLMDISLQGSLDGIETAQLIKQHQDVPIIYVTAHSDSKTLQRAKLVGPFGYVLKPFDDEIIRVTLEMALYKHKLDQEMKESRQWFATTLTSIGDAVIATDAQGRIKFMNPVAETLTGWTEAANQNLKDFAYIISHDLKAPLRAIRSLTNWFITDYGDQLGLDAKELLDLLANRVMRMDALINGVLQYSRIGRINEHKVEVDLNFVIREVIDLLAPNAKNVRFEVAPNLPTLYVEPTRIEQVFQNLIGNAIKFMDKAQGVVKIGFNDEGDYWRFSVADNGPGIEPQFWSSIFQIFQTITPRDVAESTGIGLTIVKRIVELYGGKVWVESEVGQGSTFYLTFPKPSKK